MCTTLCLDGTAPEIDDRRLFESRSRLGIRPRSLRFYVSAARTRGITCVDATTIRLEASARARRRSVVGTRGASDEAIGLRIAAAKLPRGNPSDRDRTTHSVRWSKGAARLESKLAGRTGVEVLLGGATQPAGGIITSMPTPSLSVRELLIGYRTALDALRERGVIRSVHVIADYGEWLAASALGLTLAPGGSNKGHDAVDPGTGKRYQVKVRQLTPPYFQPDLRGQGDVTDDPFDHLVGILLDTDFAVTRAIVVPLDVVQRRAKRIAYNNGWRLHMASGLLAEAGVRDVTDLLRREADR